LQTLRITLALTHCVLRFTLERQERMPNTDATPRIPARHSRLAEELIYRLLVRWPVWSQFDRVWLKIEGELPTPGHGPLIGYLSHPSWWDGYMAFLLHREVLRRGFESYLMMDERQLSSYRFFSWIGVFSVSLTDAREALRSVAYIGRLLRERRDRCLWIFPQGRLTPGDARPLHVYSGAARIARLAGGAALWPVALRYEFRGEQRPEAFIRAGPLHRAPAGADAAALTAELEARLTAACDALRDEVLGERLDDYRTLVRGRPGVNRLFDAAVRALEPPSRAP